MKSLVFTATLHHSHVRPTFSKNFVKMALARLRVLSPATKGLITGNQSCRSVTRNSHSSSLLERLIQEPVSRTKASLDLAQKTNSPFENLEFSWDALVTSLRSSSHLKAQLVLEWRLEKLVTENERNRDCYTELIHLCGKVSNIQIAMRVFTLMENQGIDPTSDVFNALISACLSSGNVISALSLFETMQSLEDCKPDSCTYTTFILKFANLGNDKTMLAWYRAKIAAGFSADIQTCEALIKGFIKSKNYGDATRFYEEMIEAGVVPNVSILHTMLEGFCELRSFERVKEFLKFILENGWEINEHIARKLVGFYYELGIVEEMEQLLETLTNMNQDLKVLSRVHNGVIKMYARLDRLDDVEYSVGRLLRQGMFFGCADDLEKVISSYFRREAYDRLDLFLERIKVSHTLYRSTYDLLIAGYRRAGLYEKVDLMVKDMNVAGVL